ncbi:MAG: cation-translocating P-type ATPase [bacterium]
MDYTSSPKEKVISFFNSSLQGLTERQADQNLQKYGYNQIKKQKSISVWEILISQFNSFIIYILIGAVIISLILGEYLDSVVILIILLMNSILGFIQEYRAEKSIEALKKMSSLKAKVFREGKLCQIESELVVPGDILLLESGDKIPADARLLEVARLEVMEAVLTGESIPVVKNEKIPSDYKSLGDLHNMVFSGTVVAKGSGKAIVVKTGMNSELGKIAESLESVEDDKTPLQKNLDSFGKRLGIVTLIICAAVIVLGIYQGEILLEMLMVGVSLAVAAIPEGLPIVVSIALAIGIRKMVKKNALIKRLPSVETLGCTTVICTDKTGTLTKNEMTVTRIYVNRSIINLSGSGYNTHGKFFSENQTPVAPDDFKMLLVNGVLNNQAALSSEQSVIGDPTEGALLVSGAKAGLNKYKLSEEIPKIHEIPFDSERKMMSTIHQKENDLIMFTKGAPDQILTRCNKILVNGKIERLTDSEKDQINQIVEQFSSQALRVLGFAYKQIPEDDDRNYSEQDLIFVGLQGMIDPPREEVKSAINTCQNAGIRVIMITGDYRTTAETIGNYLGISGEIMDGQELEEINEDNLAERISDVSIFARVNPEHKIKIVRALKQQGEVVAMTGDGVNDAPAIKAADIGIAMGITGTDVSKEAADMILIDDHFNSIMRAVKEGRGIYDNIRKFINYLLSSNLGEVLILFIAMIIGFKDPLDGSIAVPLLATQILWLNLITDGLPAIALGVDPIRRNIMKLPPRNPREKIINVEMSCNIITISILLCVSVLFLFNHFLYQGTAVARTIAFTTIVLLEMVRITMIRSQYKIPMWSNAYLWGAMGISILLQFAVVYIPFLNIIFKTVPLGIVHWIYIAGTIAAMFVIGQVLIWIMEKFKFKIPCKQKS